MLRRQDSKRTKIRVLVRQSERDGNSLGQQCFIHRKHWSAPARAQIDDMCRTANALGLTVTDKFLKGAGCEQCRFTGFSGRMAIYELMVMTDQIRSHIEAGVASDEFRKLAIASGMIPLPVNGVEQARYDYSKLTPEQRARYASYQPKLITP